VRSVRIVAVDDAEPLPTVNTGPVEELHALLTIGGRPAAQVRLPALGEATWSAAFLDAVLLSWAEPKRVVDAFEAGVAARIGARPPAAPSASDVSVVVCTHRRPEHLQRALEAIAALAPSPREIIVVDNDPGDRDSRDIALAHGARYVRADRRGLGNARHAGAAAARGAFVAFTDDDCIPAPGWLAHLDEAFADPSVGVVTGPGFAWRLTARSQREREDVASFVLGLERRTFDWTNLRPVHAGAIGAGCNMTFRRAPLADLGSVFAPELDAGTPTRSGGDLYALYRVLAAGLRAVYDPRGYVFHDHADGAGAARDTVFGYGMGGSAYLTKVLIEDRELAAVAIWHWLWQSWADQVLAGLAGRGSPVRLRLRAVYLLGGLSGAAAWAFSAVTRGRTQDALPASTPPEAPAPPESAGVALPTVSVIVRRGARPELLARCLESLRQQGAAEVLVAEDPTTAAGAASGEVVLLWAAELSPAPGVVRAHAHAHAHAGGDVIVTGVSEPVPCGTALAQRFEALRRADQLRGRGAAIVPTLADVPLENISLPRRLLAELEAPPAATPDPRNWAIRVLQARIPVLHVPTARASERIDGDTRSSLHGALRQGAADAGLVARHPQAIGALACARDPTGAQRVATVAMRFGALREAAALALGGLERLRARRTWASVYVVLARGCYDAGARRAGGTRAIRAARRGARRVIDLDASDRLDEPQIAAPLLDLHVGGRRVTRVVVPHGQWSTLIPPLVSSALATAWRAEGWPNTWRRLPAPRHEPRPWSAGSLAVLFGPGRHAGDARHRATLEAAGIRVELVDGEPADHWSALDRAIRAAPEAVVGLPLPGVTAALPSLAAAAPAFESSRVAAVSCVGLARSEHLGPLHLASRATRPGSYVPIGRPCQCLLVSTAAYRAIGGYGRTAARLGGHAPPSELLQRALDAGLVVGSREVHGIEPAGAHRPARSRGEWGRWTAHGALMAHHARACGSPAAGVRWFVLRGLLPLVLAARHARRDERRGLSYVAGTALAFGVGALRSARR
jgi:glycosyltransferase involved in cell wall biosynthesis